MMSTHTRTLSTRHTMESDIVSTEHTTHGADTDIVGSYTVRVARLSFVQTVYSGDTCAVHYSTLALMARIAA